MPALNPEHSMGTRPQTILQTHQQLAALQVNVGYGEIRGNEISVLQSTLLTTSGTKVQGHTLRVVGPRCPPAL